MSSELLIGFSGIALLGETVGEDIYSGSKSLDGTWVKYLNDLDVDLGARMSGSLSEFNIISKYIGGISVSKGIVSSAISQYSGDTATSLTNLSNALSYVTGDMTYLLPDTLLSMFTGATKAAIGSAITLGNIGPFDSIERGVLRSTLVYVPLIYKYSLECKYEASGVIGNVMKDLIGFKMNQSGSLLNDSGTVIRDFSEWHTGTGAMLMKGVVSGLSKLATNERGTSLIRAIDELSGPTKDRLANTIGLSDIFNICSKDMVGVNSVDMFEVLQTEITIVKTSVTTLYNRIGVIHTDAETAGASATCLAKLVELQGLCTDLNVGLDNAIASCIEIVS